MSERFGRVLKEYRLRRDMSLRDLAKLVNVSYSYISKLEKGQYSPSRNVVCALAQALNAPTDEFLAAAGYLPDDSQLPPGAIPVTEFTRVPVYGEIRAGQPMFVKEELLGYEWVPASDVKGGEYFFLRVKGDSMINARIQEGDLVLVRRQPTLENGQIGVIIVNDEATIKRFYKKGVLAILKPENPAYEPIVARITDVRIVGEVVEAKIKFNGR